MILTYINNVVNSSRKCFRQRKSQKDYFDGPNKIIFTPATDGDKYPHDITKLSSHEYFIKDIITHSELAKWLLKLYYDDLTRTRRKTWPVRFNFQVISFVRNLYCCGAKRRTRQNIWIVRILRRRIWRGVIFKKRSRPKSNGAHHVVTRTMCF